MTAPVRTIAADPQVDRRRFLGAGAAMLATLALTRPERALTSALRHVQLPHFGHTSAIPELSLATFAPHLGTIFEVSAAGFRAVALTLIEVTPPPSRQSQRDGALMSGEAFTLLFEGPTAQNLDAGVYRLRHNALATMDLQLSPVGRGLKAQDYQVVIDQRRFESGPAPRKAG